MIAASVTSGKPSPARVLELVRQCAAQHHSDLVVLWVQWSGDRGDLARSLCVYSAEIAVIPLVVREALFDNPNTVMVDFARLLVAHEAWIRRLVSSHDVLPSRVVVVLIARANLRIPQISSPVVLPSWFPRLGGRTVHCVIEDLDTSADVPLNAPEARIDDVCIGLFRLEGVLIDRLRRRLTINPSAADGLFEHIVKYGAEADSLEDFLDQASASRGSVRNPTGYRPSAKPNDSLSALILRIYGGTSPDKLARSAKVLGQALGVSAGVSFPPLMMSVIYRPTSPVSDENVVAARSIILTIYGAAQLITAAAHADHYPRFPVNIVRSISYDIRRGLNEAASALSQ